MMKRSTILACTAILAAYSAGWGIAEEAAYGEVALTGLARESWPLNPPGEAYAMVCNVNGPDGFLSIRATPDEAATVRRRLKRLATVTVDTAQRKGHWVRILDAGRVVTPDGMPQEYQPLTVDGWAHDGYLCDFLH